jgi:anthranilate/para-aminobenzoate synthase component II
MQQLMHGKPVSSSPRRSKVSRLPNQFTVNRYHSLAIEKQPVLTC